jgi:hypothetical protein
MGKKARQVGEVGYTILTDDPPDNWRSAHEQETTAFQSRLGCGTVDGELLSSN